jgi:hypothetical protein
MLQLQWDTPSSIQVVPVHYLCKSTHLDVHHFTGSLLIESNIYICERFFGPPFLDSIWDIEMGSDFSPIGILLRGWHRR